MSIIFEYLEQHAIGVTLFLFILIAAEAAVALLLHGKKLARRDKAKSSICLKELGSSGDLVFLLLGWQDHLPVFVSENAERILGITQESLYSDYPIVKQLLTPEQCRKTEDAIRSWNGEGRLEQEFYYGRFQEQERGRYGKLSIQKTGDGRFVLVLFEDASKEQEKRLELEHQIKEVQAVDESKTFFLSKMSHEIRTPMNGMLGMISLARYAMEAKKPEDVADYLEKAEGLSKFLLSIINDILDMSRIESNKLELEQARFNLVELSEKIRTMFQTTIEDKKIRFHMELQDVNTPWLIGDELRITQVINNFLSNSSKFTPAGGLIQVIFRQMERKDGKITVMIRVSDTGKGMSPQFLHRIFVPFEQEDSGIARKYGGSGLGMAISDSLVRMMGGQILVDSEEGKGTTFTVFLTMPEAETVREQDEAEKNQKVISLEGMRLLMAEDNKVNSMVATRMLGRQKLEIEVAENGRLALEAFQAHEKGYFQAILMDLHMPEMDGWEATRQIRKLEREDAKTIPIIALSADAFVEDRRRSLEAGMNAHVAKPIDYEELKKVLIEEISKER